MVIIRNTFLNLSRLNIVRTEMSLFGAFLQIAKKINVTTEQWC